MTSIHDLPNELLTMILDGSNSQKVICSFVSKSWLSLIDTRYLWVIRKTLINEYSKTDSLPLVKWAYERGCPFPYGFYYFTGEMSSRSIDILDWMSKFQFFDTSHSEKAALEGKLDNLKWMKLRGCLMSAYIYRGAALGGHLNIIKWLRSESVPWDEKTCAFAAKGGHLGVLQWVRANGCPWDGETLNLALENDHYEVFDWALKNGCQPNSGICQTAAKVGDFNLAKVTFGFGCKNVVRAAAEGGHLHIVKYFTEKGAIVETESVATSAAQGHLDIVKYLIEGKHCSWDGRTSSAAAWGGHLEVLQWLLSNGCPWDKDVYNQAVVKGRIKILDWLWDNGYRNFPQDCYQLATTNQMIDSVKWLYEHDCCRKIKG